MSQLFRLKNGTVLLSTEAPGGIYNSGQLKKIAELCSKELAIVKATEDQRLALFVKESEVENVAKQLRAMGLGFRHYQDSLHQPVSCLGELCEEHEQPAMATAMDITKEIASIQLNAPLKIGVNGCARCCTPCHTLDIAVVGDVSGYRISLGGKTRQMPEFASYFAEGVPPKELPKRLKAVIETYKNLAEEGETLHDVIERCGVTDFVQALAPYSQDAAQREDPFAQEASVAAPDQLDLASDDLDDEPAQELDAGLTVDDDLSIADDKLDDAGLEEIPIEKTGQGSLEDDLSLGNEDADLALDDVSFSNDAGSSDELLDDAQLKSSATAELDSISLDSADSLDLDADDAAMTTDLEDASVSLDADDAALDGLDADVSMDGDAALEADVSLDSLDESMDSLDADVSLDSDASMDSLDGDMSLDADGSLDGDASMDSLGADDDMSVEGLDADGDLSLGADETVDSDASMDALEADVSLDGDVSMDTLDVDGSLDGDISMDSLEADVSLDGDASMDSLEADVSLDGDELMDGDASMDSLEAGVSLEDDVSMDADVSLDSDMSMDADVSLDSDESDASLDDISLDGDASLLGDDMNLDSTAAVTEDDIDLEASDLDTAETLEDLPEAEMDLDESMTLDDDLPEDLSVDMGDEAMAVAETPVDEDLEGIPELDEDLALDDLPAAKAPAPASKTAAAPAAKPAPAPAAKPAAAPTPAPMALQDEFGEELQGDVPELSDEEESQFEQKLQASIDEESALIAKADKDPNVGDREAALSLLENSESHEADLDAIELDDAVLEESLAVDDELEVIGSDDELETISADDDVLEPIQETMEEFPEPGPSELAHIKSRQLGQKLQGSAPRQQFKVSAITFQDEHMRVTFDTGAYVDFDLSALGLGEERNFRLGVQNVSVTSTSEGYILEVDGMKLFHPKTSFSAAS